MAKSLAETIVDQIKMSVKALNIPQYKIVVQAVIGEISGQGVRIASKCLWNDSNEKLKYTLTMSAAALS